MVGKTEQETSISLASDIIAAYVANNKVEVSQLPELIQQVHDSLQQAAGSEAQMAQPQRPKPAVPIKRSVTPDYVICLEDGAKLKMLKRHLRTHYGLTPQQYREKWNLPPDYPMVAPNYAARRSTLAKQIGLGAKGGGASKRQRARKSAA